MITLGEIMKEKTTKKETKTTKKKIKEILMKEKIGETAGKIWGILKQKDEVNISQLPKMISEKREIVYQSLGWLAREEKIIYNQKNTKLLISLTEEEKNVIELDD